MMHRKILALIMVVLFIFTIFNSSIVAEIDISKIKRTREISKEISDMKDKLERLDDDFIKNCIETEDYSKLLEFMGKDSKLVKNVHINASGSGIYLAKKIRLVSLYRPLPLPQIGFFPPSLINQWLFYIKFDNQTHYNRWSKQNESTLTYIEPENGDPSIKITGNHSILVLVWQILPINKIIILRNKIVQWYRELKDDENFSIPFPWSFEKWRFKNYFNWNINAYTTNFIINNLPVTVYELMFMIMTWPFNVWTSFLNLFWPSKIMGMAPFVIYNNSTSYA